MATNLDKATLMELLDSNKLSEYQKIQLARHYNQTAHRAEQAEMVKAAFKAVGTAFGKAFNLTALASHLHFPQLRVKH